MTLIIRLVLFRSGTPRNRPDKSLSQILHHPVISVGKEQSLELATLMLREMMHNQILTIPTNLRLKSMSVQQQIQRIAIR